MPEKYASSGNQRPGQTQQNGRNRMSMESLRQYYNVPAKRGGRVRYTGGPTPLEGKIIRSVERNRLLVVFDGDNMPKRLHPKWNVEYLPDAAEGTSEKTQGGCDKNQPGWPDVGAFCISYCRRYWPKTQQREQMNEQR